MCLPNIAAVWDDITLALATEYTHAPDVRPWEDP